jgi:hypothetical protein
MSAQSEHPSTDVSADTPTPRETRLRLNRMERWFRQHDERFTPEDRVFLRLAFEYAAKPGDADVLANALRAGMDAPTSSQTAHA